MNKIIKKSESFVFALGIALNMTLTPGIALDTSLMNVPEPIKEISPEIRHENVPFYSQFEDIYLKEWQKLGCGIAALAMAIEFHKPDSVSVMDLLFEAIESGAYQQNVGWKHRALAMLAGQHGLTGKTYDLVKLDQQAALGQFLESLQNGPVIVSVRNKFDPAATLGHLVVATGFENDVIFYHDPAGPKIEKIISIPDFLKGWKKRFIVFEKTAS